MKRRTIIITTAVAAALGAGVVGTVAASSGGDDNEAPITGDALTNASKAALAHTGEGRVTETEVGDEESLYEVEVTLDDGRQIDVQLDENFAVVGSETDDENDDEAGDD
jgi:uncharacterized membrane protein YkoI